MKTCVNGEGVISEINHCVKLNFGAKRSLLLGNHQTLQLKTLGLRKRFN